ncbi:conserved hypothetical protein [Culex quinquefasciatus]|uniref:DUF4780 domain-containing protein n=1 Tax=Culex quinquefasciatus TaxID=7176 RepID=B0WXU5_CULQU|nr:conserved hypothetical protein [Culex quinquefasciatus]|eukprot:XP_001862217.1 conserved hypothetical protein [Culex quinquefasciatus]
MSKQETTNNQTKGPDAPQASENETPLPDGSDSTVKAEPGMEVDGEESKEAVEAKPKLHTCGSQRKRFKWFISQGYEYEEASELAKDAPKYRELRAAAEGKSLELSERDVQLAQQRKALNRVAKQKYTQLREHGYSEEEAIALAPTLVEDPASRKKHLESGGSKKSGDGVKIIVAMANYPQSVLTEDQAELVKEAILKLVVDQKVSKTKPHFAGCNFIKGYLVFDCLDPQTITWLQHRTRELQLWEGCALRAVSEKVLKSTNMFTLLLPDSEQDTDEDIANFLSKQNDGIDTAKWVFADRKLDETTKTVTLTLKIDPVSAKTLHERNYKLNYKFEQITIKKITVNLFDNSPKKTTPPTNNAPQRRPYRGGYNHPQNRFGGRGRGGFNSYNRPTTGNVMGSLYDQLSRNLAFERQVRQNNFGGGGDYIDGLLDQLNRSLYATSSGGSYNTSPYGRGGGRGGGGNRNYPRQRFF